MGSRFGGRPKREPSPGERVHLGFRVTTDLKRRMELAAQRNGRSISQEAEFRVEHSFDRDDLLPEVLTLKYGRQLAGVVMLLGLAMKLAGETNAFIKTGDSNKAKQWMDDPFAFDEAVKAVNLILEKLGPKASVEFPPALQNNGEKTKVFGGISYALYALREVAGVGYSSFFDHDEAEKIRSLLGPIADRLSREVFDAR